MKKTAHDITRRGFLGTVSTAAAGAGVVGAASLHGGATSLQAATAPLSPGAAAATAAAANRSPRTVRDGPASPLFQPLPLAGNTTLDELATSDLPENFRANAPRAPQGDCVCWGIPFRVERIAAIRTPRTTVDWTPVKARWLVFMHTADLVLLARNQQGFTADLSGRARLREHLADYVVRFADGSQVRAPIWRQHQIGMLNRTWGDNCFEAVAHQKPHPVRTTSEQPRTGAQWGNAQTRVAQRDRFPWTNWLWAWENPHPEKAIAGLEIEPKTGVIVLSAVTGANVQAHPLRWEQRRKAVLQLPPGENFQPDLSAEGLLAHLQIDLGQVISALPRTIYPNNRWTETPNNQNPTVAPRELLVEYTAHPEARFHLPAGQTVPVAELLRGPQGPLAPVAPATQRVRLRVVAESTKQPVPVKLHAHGEAGEYLPPVDRHRIVNPYWYEDWSVDYQNAPAHSCTYITGDTTLELPLGKVYLEISKGFEIAPIRQVVTIAADTRELTIPLKKVLPWREQGWVTADTHVHFLSPTSAHLEGAAEGVNVVNLLASQWGELMTNVGEFDGRLTHGSRETGGEGEYLVRVGTENRQHVLGHISLLGYNGPIIAPMTRGGPDESALGDPVDVLLTEWARQCRQQGGIVVLPHFPNPRAEHAAAIISGDIDGVEMTSLSNLYNGIDPYSLSDWYRYLNCGYFVAAVGGTDKMSAQTAVGAVRTYAKLPKDRPFDYDAWKEAIRSGHTFATYGPLLEFSVDGHPPGARLKLGSTGGTFDIEWRVASVTVPMTRVELIVNGEIRESQAVAPKEDRGHWRVKAERSSWVALLVRGHYRERPEIIAAHSSPVMIAVEGTPFFSAADALTILHQVEGALAYLDTVGTRAETATYQRMRLVLTGAHRALHNRLHERGVYHEHTHATDHPEHH